MPFGIQPIHLIVIVIVALIIFGPQRFPEIGRGLGRALQEFRKGTREMTESFRDEMTKTAAESTPTVATTPPADSSPAAPTKAAATADHSLFCTQCGAGNPADARFCKSCGAQLNR